MDDTLRGSARFSLGAGSQKCTLLELQRFNFTKAKQCNVAFLWLILNILYVFVSLLCICLIFWSCDIHEICPGLFDMILKLTTLFYFRVLVESLQRIYRKCLPKVYFLDNFDQILTLSDVDRALTSSVHTVVILELCLLVTAQKRRCMKAKS
jgi:hypothetical protein